VVTDGPGQQDGKDLPVDPGVPQTTPATARRWANWVLRERWDILLVIAAGGALGSLARWAVTEVVSNDPWHLPWGTFLENVGGAFALGLLMVFVLDVWPPHRYLRPFLAVGVLGGYTTFSTYMLDTHALLVDGHAPAALGYLFGTMIIGLLAVGAGVLLARITVRSAQRRLSRRAARHDRPRGGRVEASAHPRSSSDSEPDPGIDPDPDQTARRTR
jgi:CrcB protein